MNTALERIFKFVLTTKLFWGLAVLYATGVVLSPVNNKGINIFLSPGNQADVLRQVSNNGIIAVGMTLVILTGGIDLSVGSMMALGSVICAMLLEDQQGWTNASLFSIPILAVVCVILCLYLIPLIAMSVPGAAHRTAEKPATKIVAAGAFAGLTSGRGRSCLDGGTARAEIWCSRRACYRAGRRACAGCLERRHHRQGPPPTIYRHPGDDGRDSGAGAVAGRPGRGCLSGLYGFKCNGRL